MSQVHRQQGIALVVSLLILMLVAILGISAMRMSLFNAKVATSAQASTLAFQGAESAVTAAFAEARDQGDTPGSIINAALQAFSASGTTQIQARCVTALDISSKGSCEDGEYLDSRGLVRAESSTILTGRRVLAGSQVSYSGSGSVTYGYYDFLTAGTGEVPKMSVSSHNVQEYTKFGPLAAAE